MVFGDACEVLIAKEKNMQRILQKELWLMRPISRLAEALQSDHDFGHSIGEKSNQASVIACAVDGVALPNGRHIQHAP
jgi:hypothetical protein